jgi:hypothetical protein
MMAFGDEVAAIAKVCRKGYSVTGDRRGRPVRAARTDRPDKGGSNAAQLDPKDLS